MELISQGNVNPTIPNISEYIRNNKDEQIDMKIIYKSIATVIIQTRRIRRKPNRLCRNRI